MPQPEPASKVAGARRKELGLTQGQVAARIQTEEGRAIGQTYLAEIERGHHRIHAHT